MTTPRPDVVDDTAARRFVLETEGHEAGLVYRVDGDRLVLVHTEVPEALGGRGVGGRLVQAALDRARRDALTVVPECAFARRWIGRHPDAVAGVAVAVPPDDA